MIANTVSKFSARLVQRPADKSTAPAATVDIAKLREDVADLRGMLHQAFRAKFPDHASYQAAYSKIMADIKSAPAAVTALAAKPSGFALEPSPNPSSPPARKAIYITTDKRVIDTAAELAGKPILNAWLAVADNVSKYHVSKFSWSHQGRVVHVFGHAIPGFGGPNHLQTKVVRWVALEHDAAPENEAILKSTLDAIKLAIADQSLERGDEAIRELGAAEGWPTEFTVE